MKDLALNIPEDKPLWQLTVGEFKALVATTVEPTASKYLDENELFAEFGLKKASADARGIPRGRMGRKSRWLRSDVEAAIKMSTVAPKPPKKREITGVNEDPIEKMLRNGELIAVRGRR